MTPVAAARAPQRAMIQSACVRSAISPRTEWQVAWSSGSGRGQDDWGRRLGRTGGSILSAWL